MAGTAERRPTRTGCAAYDFRMQSPGPKPNVPAALEPAPGVPAPSGLDPMALGFLVIVALLFLAGVALGVRALLEHQPQAGGSSAGGARQAADRLIEKLRAPAPVPVPAPKTKPQAQALTQPSPANAMNAADPKRSFAAAVAPAAPQVRLPPVGANWTYDVYFGPDWNKAGQLAYQTQPQEKDKVGASMAWMPRGGKTSSWVLGIVLPDHPTHANTRFPGFFMHPAYFPQALVPGSRLLWEIPWQGGDAKMGVARARRYDMKVIAWERVSVAAGEFDAAHLAGALRYMEGENVKAEVRYSLWYAPRAKQVVRVLWEGRAPDEGQSEIIVELASFRVP